MMMLSGVGRGHRLMIGLRVHGVVGELGLLRMIMNKGVVEMSEDATIGDLAKQVEEAKRALEKATENTNAARCEETECLNRYNELCKKFDAAVAELHKESPRGTDWRGM